MLFVKLPIKFKKYCIVLTSCPLSPRFMTVLNCRSTSVSLKPSL